MLITFNSTIKMKRLLLLNIGLSLSLEFKLKLPCLTFVQ